MKLLRFFASLMLVGGVVFMTACSDDDEDAIVDENTSTDESGSEESGQKPNSGISLAPGASDTVYLTADEGSSNTVSILSYESWTAEVAYNDGDGWLSVSPTSGDAGDDPQTVTVTATAANSGGDRTAVLTFAAESGDKVSVNVVQSEPVDGIALAPDTSDTIELEAGNATYEVQIVSYESWTASISYTDGEGWLSVSPESGSSSTSYQTLTLTADNNYDKERDAVLTVTTESGKDVSVKVQQAVANVTTTVEISDVFAYGKESSATVTVTYFGVCEGDEADVSVELGGASDGLEVDASGDGFTVSGTPEGAGALTATATVKVGDVEVSTGIGSTTVYVIRHTFEQFNWGGDYVGMQNGMNPTSDGSQASGTNAPEGGWTGLEPGISECASTKAGTNRMFDPASYTETFWANMDITEWAGSCNFMFYHQMQIGHDSEKSWLITPALKALTGETKIKVEVDMCRHHSSSKEANPIIGFYANDKKRDDDGGYKGSGNFDNDKDSYSIDQTVLPAHSSATDDLEWVPITWEATASQSDNIMIWCGSHEYVMITNFRISVVE